MKRHFSSIYSSPRAPIVSGHLRLPNVQAHLKTSSHGPSVT